MIEEKKDFDQAMSESKNELEALRTALNDLMVRFGLRTLRTYQTARKEPLKRGEIGSLVKYEMTNVIADLSQPSNIETIIKRTTLEWERQQQK